MRPTAAISTPPCRRTVSNPAPGGLNQAAFTFGHGPDFTLGQAPARSCERDRAAAAWWAPGARPSTNDAAGADVEAFWAAARAPGGAGAGAAVADLTGRGVAAATKAAGRGAHVSLGCEEDSGGGGHNGAAGSSATAGAKGRSGSGGGGGAGSLYRDDFCRGGAAGAAASAAATYAAATRAARANRALGAGASLCLKQEW